jgi:hypothetical protein
LLSLLHLVHKSAGNCCPVWPLQSIDGVFELSLLLRQSVEFAALGLVCSGVRYQVDFPVAEAHGF